MTAPHGDPLPHVARLDELLAHSGPGSYREFLRVPALSLGVFAPADGPPDRQQPHAQDEVYVVMTGTGVLDIDGVAQDIAPGTVAYVPAGVRHRFASASADLAVVVVFAPPLD